MVVPNICGSLVSHNAPSDNKNFEVAPRFLKKLVNPYYEKKISFSLANI
jgi:hypothetical protein